MNLNSVIDRLLAVLSRDLTTDELVRHRFRKVYNIDVGQHSFWRFNSDRVSHGTQIGRYCSISGSARVIDQNHPLDALSTSPLFYLKNWGLTADDRLHEAPTVIEDDVWLGHAAIITPGCKRVGRGAVIGAGAVVMRDVPRYAIMMGAPARLVRFRFPPELVEAIEATRWWELEPDELKAETADNPDFLTSPTLNSARRFLQRRGIADITAPERSTPRAGSVLDERELIEAFRREAPGFTIDMLDVPIGEIGIDSFGLINLRLTLEQRSGRRIGDADWGAITVPRDLIKMRATSTADVSATSAPPPRVGDSYTELVGGNGERRRYALNMPRMAMSGLSESWLLKEAVAIHWDNIARGLGTTTDQITDDTGRRLYATVTRCRVESSAPLSSFRENEEIELELATSRMGAGIFLGEGALTGRSGKIHLRLMTSFAAIGEQGANATLLKGQPVVPETCPIPNIAEAPHFVDEYRSMRSQVEPEPLFSVDYAVQPPHDINGVGLLYFAAYPIIADLCAGKCKGMHGMTDFSTVRRDVSYFANADPSETLVYKLLRWEECAGVLETEALLARKSDGMRMARVFTRKERTSPRP